MHSWEKKIDIHKVFVLQPTRPLTTFGAGALARLDGIVAAMVRQGHTSFLVVTDPIAYKACGAWDTIRPILDAQVQWVHYDGVRPNPTFANCDTAAVIGANARADAVLAIGGGSALDTAKTAAVLLRHRGKKAVDFYEKGTPIKDAVPVVAINTTHGTGSECDAYAVAQSDGEDKPVIHSPHLYPTYTIEDPALTLSLPTAQTISTTMDAVSHALEAATAVSASPYGVILAKEAVRLGAVWLPTAIVQPDNLAARYWLMYASAIAGMGYDLGMLHVAHALEHAMSALNASITHGEGLGILLPAVLREIYPAVPEALAEILAPIAPGLAGVPGEAEIAATRVREWLCAVGQSTTMGTYFTGADVPALTRMALKSPLSKQLLPQTPIRVNEEVVRRIFQNSL
jgi:alcohol dehydrogenase class IV